MEEPSLRCPARALFITKLSGDSAVVALANCRLQRKGSRPHGPYGALTLGGSMRDRGASGCHQGAALTAWTRAGARVSEGAAFAAAASGPPTAFKRSIRLLKIVSTTSEERVLPLALRERRLRRYSWIACAERAPGTACSFCSVSASLVQEWLDALVVVLTFLSSRHVLPNPCLRCRWPSLLSLTLSLSL